MNSKPLIGVSFELFFQIFNSILILAIFIFVIYVIFIFLKKFTIKNNYDRKIKELEDKVSNLENRIKYKL